MFSKLNQTYPNDIVVYRPFAPAADRPVWEGLPENIRSEALKHAESYLNYEYPQLPASLFMDFLRTGNRDHYQLPFDARRKALNALTMGECVENQGRFIDDIINGIICICEESGWQFPAHNWADQTIHHNWAESEFYPLADPVNPVLDLAACDTASQLALVRYLLKDQLDQVSPLICKRINDELHRRVLTPYTNQFILWMCKKGGFSNNWTPWCTMNMLIALLSLDDIDQTTRRQILTQATESLDIFLDTYGEDGCCNEGASYYRIACLTMFSAIDVLNAVTNGHFSELYQTAKIKNMAAYILNVHVDGDYYFNFADCSAKPGPSGVREYLAAKAIGDENLMLFAAKDEHRQENHLPFERVNLFFWLQAAFGAAQIAAHDLTPAVIKDDLYYDSVGLLIARDSRFSLAVRSGSNDDSHNHNDCGSFILYKNGEPLLIDIGVETYTKKTFSEYRYDIWTMQSAYHNVMTFDSQMQLNGSQYRATEIAWALSPKRAEISFDLAQAYPAGTINSYLRKVVFDKEQEIRITDCCSPLPAGTCLTLMSTLLPEYQDGLLNLGGQQEIVVQGDCRVEIETILLTDPKLMDAWGNTIYRTKIYLAAPELTLVIPAKQLNQL